MKVDILNKGLSGFKSDAWHVKRDDGKYFIVSGVIAMFSGWEVLVFPSNEKGEVISWGEVAGGRGITHENAIKQLENGEEYS